MREDYKMVLEMNLNKIRFEFDKHIKNNDGYFDIDYTYEMYQKYGDLFDIAKQYNNNYFQRRTRLNKKIQELLFVPGYHYFLTLTFTDDVLNNTNPITRRKYVTKFLKLNFPVYIANIDFGSENGREHYHCIVLSNYYLEKKTFKWSYGLTNLKTIVVKDKTNIKLSKYITKLTSHALKVYEKNPRYIYSRKKK